VSAVRRLSTREPEFLATLDALLAFDSGTDDAIERTVADILTQVRTVGDAAVIEYTCRFDRLDV
jgi:histidinol dehydrogenase